MARSKTMSTSGGGEDEEAARTLKQMRAWLQNNRAGAMMMACERCTLSKARSGIRCGRTESARGEDDYLCTSMNRGAPAELPHRTAQECGERTEGETNTVAEEEETERKRGLRREGKATSSTPEIKESGQGQEIQPREACSLRLALRAQLATG